METGVETALRVNGYENQHGVPGTLLTPHELIEAGAVCVIAYARISCLAGKRADGNKRAKGVSNQHVANRDIARRESLTVVKLYTDNDRSASKDEFRPAFEAMLADLHRGFTIEGFPVHGIVSVDDDRIFKTPEQWHRFIEAFRASEARVFADEVGTRDLYSEDAETFGLLRVAIAMEENRKRVARTRRWHEGQARRGIAHTGGRAFGYRPVTNSPGEIAVVPEEADVIRAAVTACIEGCSWGSITEIFVRSGIPTEKGGPWRIQTVRQIISSPRNAGLRLIDGELYKGEDGEAVYGQWEPIITRPEWEAVVQRYMPRRRLPGGNTKDARPIGRKYLLSGLLRCGKTTDGHICGCVMQASVNTQGAAKYRYSCRARGEGGCAGASVSGEWIDREISELVLISLESRSVHDTGRSPWPYEEVLTTSLAKLDAFEAEWRRGLVSDDEFNRLLARLEATASSLRIDQASYEGNPVVSLESDAERRARWWTADVEGGYDLTKKRALIFEELETVLIFPVGRGNRIRTRDSYRPVFR